MRFGRRYTWVCAEYVLPSDPTDSMEMFYGFRTGGKGSKGRETCVSLRLIEIVASARRAPVSVLEMVIESWWVVRLRSTVVVPLDVSPKQHWRLLFAVLTR